MLYPICGRASSDCQQVVDIEHSFKAVFPEQTIILPSRHSAMEISGRYDFVPREKIGNYIGIRGVTSF